jgi:hypothetical protein
VPPPAVTGETATQRMVIKKKKIIEVLKRGNTIGL